ncbi:hypothetical protein [Nocardia anaemiae]|uniref:hypothetical protein n=1 Tax=Nocardia anaemiae TaxID=263910 RepID=UPI0007A4E39B|nr:hypothetical protein [Nocardia anaemiae]
MTDIGQHHDSSGLFALGRDHTVRFGRDRLLGGYLLARLHRRFAERAAAAQNAASDEVGRYIDLGSPDEVHIVLADELGLSIQREASTDRAVLSELAQQYPHPFLTHLLDWHDAIRDRDTVATALPVATRP